MDAVALLLQCDWSSFGSDTLLQRLQCALVAAASGGHRKVVEYVLNCKVLPPGQTLDLNALDLLQNSTALSSACRNGHHALVDLLLSKGARIDVRNGEGESSLLVAANYGHWQLLDKFLMDSSCSIEEKNDKGKTALMLAAANGHVGVVEVLIEKGVSTVTKDLKGQSCLTHACRNNQVSALRKLIQANVDPNVVDNGGNGLLHLAASTKTPSSEMVMFPTQFLAFSHENTFFNMTIIFVSL